MSISDTAAYIIAFLAYWILQKKCSWFENFTCAGTVSGCAIKNIISYVFLYFIAWSALNWCFYVNLYILLNSPFDFGWKKSFHTAMTLTNEYSSVGFYMQWFADKEMGNNHIDLMDQLVKGVRECLDKIGEASDDESALSAIGDVLHIFY